MAYSGRYRPVNLKKYKGNPDKIVYRSLWERDCFIWCDKSKEVLEWSSEEVIVPYYYDVDKKWHSYYPDLKVKLKDKTLLIEIKPLKETKLPKRPDKSKRYIKEALTYVKNQNKWEQAESFAKDRGWKFEVWTEETLKSKGIMKKGFRKLKPLPPFRKKRHK